jgi:type IV secretory pathway VirB10-like protein
MNFLVGNPSTVYPLQDHESHIAVHMNFAQLQAAENPDLVQMLEPVIQAHIMEHKAYVYRAQVEAELGTQLPYINLDDPTENEDLPPDLEQLISMAVAKKLQPPPPPAPSPEEQAEQDEAQREEDERDLEVIGKIERGRAESAAGIDRDDEESEAEQKRKDEESKAEGKRKDTESRAEVRRLDRKARAIATFGRGPVSAVRSAVRKKAKKRGSRRKS